MNPFFGDKYQLINKIGEGATGVVYIAKDLKSQEDVAIKILDSGLARDQKFVDRFKREAEVLRAFNHPGSVKLRDAGTSADGRHYLVMDYCRGKSLKALIDEERKIAPTRAIRITMELLAVLDAAHQRGIIHRDVKPENVMVLAPDDFVQVLDFGVAKLKERVSTVTIEGAAVGTPQYMSPEQASGEKDIDIRADIYGAGVILYELLSGTPPYAGRSVMHTLLMVLTHPIPSLPESLELPPSLEDAIKKSLEKDRTKRFQSAEEFLKALEVAYKDCHAGKKKIVTEAPQLPPPSPVATPEAIIAKPKSDGKKRIVCLDDQEMIINIMKHLLEHEGYEVVTSTSWEVLHTFLFSNSVDLLVSDVEMPGIRGTAICQLLKKTMPELKVVLFSNVPERDLAKLAEEAEADAWISKNWTPPQWLKSIKTALGE